ncbi:MAG TPA: hypothetical protein DEP91_08190, partial [Sphingomonas bacterium]|nr:hypothetical protein [Sphingomonas bacterium]
MNRFSMIALAGLAATSTLAMAQTTPGRTPMQTSTQAQPMTDQTATTTTTAATPAAATGTIADAAMANPKLSTLVSAV